MKPRRGVQKGRTSFLATNKKKHDAAVQHLDRGISTVVLEYVRAFNVIKNKRIESDPDERVFEGAYGDRFSDLCAALADGVQDDTTRRMLLKVCE